MLGFRGAVRTITSNAVALLGRWRPGPDEVHYPGVDHTAMPHSVAAHHSAPVIAQSPAAVPAEAVAAVVQSTNGAGGAARAIRTRARAFVDPAAEYTFDSMDPVGYLDETVQRARDLAIWHSPEVQRIVAPHTNEFVVARRQDLSVFMKNPGTIWHIALVATPQGRLLRVARASAGLVHRSDTAVAAGTAQLTVQDNEGKLCFSVGSGEALCIPVAKKDGRWMASATSVDWQDNPIAEFVRSIVRPLPRPV